MGGTQVNTENTLSRHYKYPESGPQAAAMLYSIGYSSDFFTHLYALCPFFSSVFLVHFASCRYVTRLYVLIDVAHGLLSSMLDTLI